MYKLSKVPIKTRMWSISLIDIVAKQKKHDFTHQQNYQHKNARRLLIFQIKFKKCQSHTSTKLLTKKFKKKSDFKK